MNPFENTAASGTGRRSRTKLLIVDDEELNRALLSQLFEDDYDIVCAANGKEALEKFKEHRDEFAAVLLDLIMPVTDGYSVLLELNTEHETDIIPVVVITANMDMEVALSCYQIGAAEIINKPFMAAIVRRRVTNVIELFSSRERLKQKLNVSERKVLEREEQLEQFNSKFIDTVSDMVEFRDMESGQHVKRVKAFTNVLANAYAKLFPEKGLDTGRIDMIVKLAALHDIGKIAIPDSILLKPGRFTPEERKIMESHTVKGCEILKKLKDVQDSEHYAVAYEIVRHHHERYDGNGYPDKLKGDEIPLSAALVSVADVYDALTSKRCYKDAYKKDKAFNMIVNGECGIFSPDLMKCFELSRGEMEQLADLLTDEKIE